MLNSDTVGQISSALGVDTSQLESGMGVAGPAALGALSNLTSSSDGASGLMDLLSQADASGQAAGGDPLGMLGGLLGSLSGGQGGTSADMMQGVFGGGINAISGTLSQKLGFDVKPMLMAAVPMLLGLINKTVKEGGLDASGLADMVQAESRAFKADPANEATVAMLDEAMKAGESAVALKGQYSDEEWNNVHLAPYAAAYLVKAASPSKGRAALQELDAAVDAVTNAVKATSPVSVLGTAYGNGLTGDQLRKLADTEPTTEAALNMLSKASTAIKSKSPGDAQAFNDMIVAVAEQVAGAAKEGGFLGIGGKQVSDAESTAIEAIRKALA